MSAQLIAERTDLSRERGGAARTRNVHARAGDVQEAEEAAKQAADEARKATAYASLWLVVSLLVGAFVASLMATYGGRQRDL